VCLYVQQSAQHALFPTVYIIYLGMLGARGHGVILERAPISPKDDPITSHTQSAQLLAIN